MPQLPPDCALLPIDSGRLLVSPGHATFCPVPKDQVADVENVLAGAQEVTRLPAELLERLRRHGFFSGPRPAPRRAPRVRLQLTNACNLRCDYCCTSSGQARGRELSPEQWWQVVLDTRRAYGAQVDFALLGGEPLLSPFALELAEYVLALPAELTLYTNGVLLSDPSVAARVAGLARRGAVLRVSLAGVTRSSCDARSGAGRFDRMLEGIRAVDEKGGRALLDLMLFPSDVEKVSVHLPELRRRIPRRTRLALALAFHGGREKGAHVFASRAVLEEALDRIALETGEAISAPPRAPVTERRDACSCAMGQSLSVRSDGRLYACYRMEEPVGDLFDQDIVECIARLRASPRPASAFAPCSGCPLRTLCGGGCRSDNLLFGSGPEKPLCGPWRVRVLSELLAEERVSCLEWPTVHLAAEAVARGIAGAPVSPVRGHPILQLN